MPEYTQPNSFATGGIRTENIFSVYDAGKPQYVEMLTKRFGMQFTPFWDWFKRMGREEAIAGNGEWYAYEDNRYRRELKVLSNVADPGVGGDTTFQLDPTYIDSDGNYYGREGEAVTIPGTNVQAHIASITGTSPNIYFLLRPVSSTSNIGALAAGTKLAITNGAYASGTGQPKGVTVGYTKRDFMLQIFKETVGLEGAEITKEQWFDAFDSNGKKVGVVSDLTTQATNRLNSKYNGAFLLGEKTTNPNMVTTTPRGSVNKIRYTEGLIPTITKLGQTLSVPYGTFVIDDLDDVGLYIKSQGVESNVVMVPTGAKRRNEIENACKSYIQGNGSDLTQEVKTYLLGNDPADKLLSIGFQQIYKGGYHFLLKTVDDWSDPVGLGMTGYDLDKTALFIPLASMKDPMSGAKLDNVATRYVSKNGYDRRFEMWQDGAAGSDSSIFRGDVDEKLYYMRAHLGLQLICANQMLYMTA